MSSVYHWHWRDGLAVLYGPKEHLLTLFALQVARDFAVEGKDVLFYTNGPHERLLGRAVQTWPELSKADAGTILFRQGTLVAIPEQFNGLVVVEAEPDDPKEWARVRVPVLVVQRSRKPPIVDSIPLPTQTAMSANALFEMANNGHWVRLTKHRHLPLVKAMPIPVYPWSDLRA